MKYRAKFHIYQALNRLEGLSQRRYSDNEIAALTGLHRHTIASIRKGREDKLISHLLQFFHDQNMPISVEDLFTVTVITDETVSKQL